jgi:hypothetical protein
MWRGYYRDADGREIEVRLSTNKTAAEQMLNDLVRKVEFAKSGILDPFERHRKTPLADHLDDWAKSLRSDGSTASPL